MAHYLLLIDGTPSQGEGATTSTGPADAGKLIALGADGALDVSLLPADLTLSTLSLLNAPISDDQVPTKGYVDAKVSGIVWQNPVEGIADFTAAEPAPSTVGERWINTATGLASSTGQSVAEDAIYTWDGGAWTETLAEDAMTLRDRSSGNLVNFNGTEWVDTGDVVNHDSLAGLQGGLAGEHYHLSAAERSQVQGLSAALADKAEASDLDAHTTSTTAHGISAYGATLVGAGNAGIARTALALTDSATRDSVIVSNGFADAGKLPRLNGSGLLDLSVLSAVLDAPRSSLTLAIGAEPATPPPGHIAFYATTEGLCWKDEYGATQCCTCTGTGTAAQGLFDSTGALLYTADGDRLGVAA